MKAAVFIGGRADYGLQLPIMRALRDAGQKVRVIQSSTLRGGVDDGTDPAADGFPPHATLNLDMPDDLSVSRAVGVGAVIAAVAQYLVQHSVDVVVVYGDRQEAFGAAVAASQVGIPVAHVEGGDVTEGGCNDDSLRHAITKLAALHFASNAVSAQRILQMGEEPWRVYNVGYTGADYALTGEYMAAEDVCRDLEIPHGAPIVTWVSHAVAAEAQDAGQQGIEAALAIAKTLRTSKHEPPERKTYAVILHPNADHGGGAMLAELQKLAYHEQVRMRPNLGRARYHGLLAYMGVNGGVLAGNSSSGIKEAGAYGCPSVDVGDRQSGRMRGAGVASVGWDWDSIRVAIEHAMGRDNADREHIRTWHPYSLQGGAAAKIARVLGQLPERRKLIVKRWRIGDGSEQGKRSGD